MATVTCPLCGSRVNSETSHCPECGADPHLDAEDARYDLVARGVSTPVARGLAPQWRWPTGVLALLAAPLVIGGAIASVGIVASLVIGMSDAQSEPAGYYAAGLPGLVALAIVAVCTMQLIAYGDGALAIFQRKASRAVWRRIAIEVATAGLLVLLVAVPLATPVSRAGWLLVVLPVAGAYLVAVGFLVVRPRARREGTLQ